MTDEENFRHGGNGVSSASRGGPRGYVGRAFAKQARLLALSLSRVQDRIAEGVRQLDDAQVRQPPQGPAREEGGSCFIPTPKARSRRRFRDPAKRKAPALEPEETPEELQRPRWMEERLRAEEARLLAEAEVASECHRRLSKRITGGNQSELTCSQAALLNERGHPVLTDGGADGRLVWSQVAMDTLLSLVERTAKPQLRAEASAKAQWVCAGLKATLAVAERRGHWLENEVQRLEGLLQKDDEELQQLGSGQERLIAQLADLGHLLEQQGGGTTMANTEVKAALTCVEDIVIEVAAHRDALEVMNQQRREACEISERQTHSAEASFEFDLEVFQQEPEPSPSASHRLLQTRSTGFDRLETVELLEELQEAPRPHPGSRSGSPRAARSKASSRTSSKALSGIDELSDLCVLDVRSSSKRSIASKPGSCSDLGSPGAAGQLPSSGARKSYKRSVSWPAAVGAAQIADNCQTEVRTPRQSSVRFFAQSGPAALHDDLEMLASRSLNKRGIMSLGQASVDDINTMELRSASKQLSNSVCSNARKSYKRSVSWPAAVGQTEINDLAHPETCTPRHANVRFHAQSGRLPSNDDVGMVASRSSSKRSVRSLGQASIDDLDTMDLRSSSKRSVSSATPSVRSTGGGRLHWRRAQPGPFPFNDDLEVLALRSASKRSIRSLGQASVDDFDTMDVRGSSKRSVSSAALFAFGESDSVVSLESRNASKSSVLAHGDRAFSEFHDAWESLEWRRTSKRSVAEHSEISPAEVDDDFDTHQSHSAKKLSSGNSSEAAREAPAGRAFTPYSLSPTWSELGVGSPPSSSHGLATPSMFSPRRHAKNSTIAQRTGVAAAALEAEDIGAAEREKMLKHARFKRLQEIWAKEREAFLSEPMQVSGQTPMSSASQLNPVGDSSNSVY